MKGIAAAVLIFEAIVIALAIPVAINVYGADAGLSLAIGGVLVVAAVTVAVTMRRINWGITAGWVVQAGMLAMGAIVPEMVVLALLFAALYYAVLRMGRQVDLIRAQQSAPDPGEDR